MLHNTPKIFSLIVFATIIFMLFQKRLVWNSNDIAISLMTVGALITLALPDEKRP